MTSLRLALALVAAFLAAPAWGGSATGSFSVALQVLPRVRTGLPGGQRAAFVSTAGARALPCGPENSAACIAAAATAARSASSPTAPVILTVLPDGSPTAVVDR
jgi:hypothetical protein